jgi:hypothetical protein
MSQTRGAGMLDHHFRFTHFLEMHSFKYSEDLTHSRRWGQNIFKGLFTQAIIFVCHAALKSEDFMCKEMPVIPVTGWWTRKE